MSTTDQPANGPFEGPEKLLEIWFAPSPVDLAAAADGKLGLRKVPQAVWEDMLDIVKCKILSVVECTEMDAYLLRCVSGYVHIHLDHASSRLDDVLLPLRAVLGRDLT